MPVEVVGNPAAERRADGRRDDDSHAVEGEGLAALFNREGVGEDGLLAGGESAAAEALENAGDDKQGKRLRQAAQQRADGEHRDAGHVEALAADAVGEPTGDGQNDGARDQVAGQHPGGFLLAGAERAGHVRQRDVGDGGVEHLHEGGQRYRDCDGPWIVRGLPVQLIEGQLSHAAAPAPSIFEEKSPCIDSIVRLSISKITFGCCGKRTDA